MATSKVKLLGASTSPYVNWVQIALKLKSIHYQFLEEKFGSKSDLLLKSNPVHKKMPVLIHGDKPICESFIIAQYIDNQWTTGPSILPSEPYDCAIARFWGAYVDDKWFPTMWELRMVEGDKAKQAVLERVMEGLVLLEDAFGKCSKGKDFFGGDNIGYIDIAFGSILGWLKVAEKMLEVELLDQTKTHGLVGWAHKFCSHEAVKDFFPETKKLLKRAKMFQAKAIAQ